MSAMNGAAGGGCSAFKRGVKFMSSALSMRGNAMDVWMVQAPARVGGTLSGVCIGSASIQRSAEHE